MFFDSHTLYLPAYIHTIGKQIHTQAYIHTCTYSTHIDCIQTKQACVHFVLQVVSDLETKAGRVIYELCDCQLHLYPPSLKDMPSYVCPQKEHQPSVPFCGPRDLPREIDHKNTGCPCQKESGSLLLLVAWIQSSRL